MLTPLDIQNKEFEKGFRGYKEPEVDSFLDEIITDYEKTYNENKELKEKVAMLNDQIKHYNDIEETLQNTLVVAQRTAEDVNINSKNKADQIIKEAEIEARKIIENAHDEVVKIQRKYEEIKKDIIVFKTRFRTLLKSQLDTFDEYYDELRAEGDFNDILNTEEVIVGGENDEES
ncbi:DivIVA domain-containing protein [Clostridiisalibacter paucivorans]|uniref:DivIVA domain-containing protein n=1 Tax=Clostridiisalibacter paucivorans TaxID=408753 RepID=UPI000687C1EC|nr:DivIVA domain-containing protein [Clostridiisalibacter paucivorans]